MSFGKKVILIADDEEDIRSALKEILSENYIVYAAENGSEAVQMTRNITPDAVIMDVLMPDMDGLSACRILKSSVHTATIPVMFLSVRNQLQETRQAFDAGADAYMTKPFSAEKLLAKIESIISKAEMLKEIKAAKPV